MSTYIKVTMWVTIIAVFVAMQLMAADLSPQHKEFLEIFFIKFPKVLFERCFSVFL